MGLKFGKDIEMHPTAIINVEEGFIGDRAKIRAYAKVEGRSVTIGHEATICEYAMIGGGNCYEGDSSLVAGDFLHVGRNAFLNQGFGIKLGHECGLGVETKLYTHGNYLSEWGGFPAKRGRIRLGDNVWVPNAQVNPGVDIGKNTVIRPMSLVTKDMPSGCLAGGIPCVVVKENAYSRVLTDVEKSQLWLQIFSQTVRRWYGKSQAEHLPVFGAEDIDRYRVDDMNGHVTIFDLKHKTINGQESIFSDMLKTQLRRHGIRFRYYGKDGNYVRW